MPLQLPREGIPQCKLMANRSEMEERNTEELKYRMKSLWWKGPVRRQVILQVTKRKKDQFYMHHLFPWIKFHSLVEENDQ